MDIIAEKIPDEPVRSDSLEEAQLNAAVHATNVEQPTLTRETTTTQDDLLNPREAPAPKKRGRPPGSRNKPKVIEEPLPPEPVLLEPEVEELAEEEPLPPPPKQKKARAPKAKSQPTYAPPPTPQQQQPQVSTPLQVAASMLEILRLEQAERQYRKGQLYKSWVK